MAAVKSNVRGLREVSEVLRKLPGRVAERAVEKALREGARPIVKAARRRAPYPAMRKAIKVRRASRRARASGSLIWIGIEKPQSSLAHLFEFGTGPRVQATTGRATGRIPAQPFMRPAIDEAGTDAVRIIGRRLGQEVERETGRMTARPPRRR